MLFFFASFVDSEGETLSSTSSSSTSLSSSSSSNIDSIPIDTFSSVSEEETSPQSSSSLTSDITATLTSSDSLTRTVSYDDMHVEFSKSSSSSSNNNHTLDDDDDKQYHTADFSNLTFSSDITHAHTLDLSSTHISVNEPQKKRATMLHIAKTPGPTKKHISVSKKQETNTPNRYGRNIHTTAPIM